MKKILEGKDIIAIGATANLGSGKILIYDNEDNMYYLNPRELLPLIRERCFNVKLKETKKHLRMREPWTEIRKEGA